MPLNVGQQKVKDNRELSPTGVRKPSKNVTPAVRRDRCFHMPLNHTRILERQLHPHRARGVCMVVCCRLRLSFSSSGHAFRDLDLSTI